MKEYNLLINLIKSGIKNDANAVEKENLSNESVRKALVIAKMNEVLPFVFDAINENKIYLPSEIKAKALQRISGNISYLEKQRYEIETLRTLFNENGINFILLKGAKIRDFYDKPYYRNSCDIDILIKEQDLEKAKGLLVDKLKYTQQHVSMHDIGYSSSINVSVELHFTLVEEGNSNEANEILNNAWNYAQQRDRCEYEFSQEFFYFYFICHLVKHFASAGCGLRFFIDLYYINNRAKIVAENCKEILQKGNVYTFTKYAEQLINVWFNNEEHNETTLFMEKFILDSGIYGSVKKDVEIRRSKNGGKVGYFFSRVWVPNKTIYLLFPKSRKHKILIPFYQIKRWFMILFGGNVKARYKRLKIANSTSDSEAKNIKKNFKELGIDFDSKQKN